MHGFVVMVNDLDIPTSKLWRYVDDTSMAGTILKGGSSTIQNDVDDLINQSGKMQGIADRV